MIIYKRSCSLASASLAKDISHNSSMSCWKALTVRSFIQLFSNMPDSRSILSTRLVSSWNSLFIFPASSIMHFSIAVRDLALELVPSHPIVAPYIAQSALTRRTSVIQSWVSSNLHFQCSLSSRLRCCCLNSLLSERAMTATKASIAVLSAVIKPLTSSCVYIMPIVTAPTIPPPNPIKRYLRRINPKEKRPTPIIRDDNCTSSSNTVDQTSIRGLYHKNPPLWHRHKSSRMAESHKTKDIWTMGDTFR